MSVSSLLKWIAHRLDAETVFLLPFLSCLVLLIGLIGLVLAPKEYRGLVWTVTFIVFPIVLGFCVGLGCLYIFVTVVVERECNVD